MKGCPWCAGTDIKTRPLGHWAGYAMYDAVCQTPGCTASGPIRSPEARAIAAWNRRAECRPPEGTPDGAVPTLNSCLPPSEICRLNGWGEGTHLAGDEGQGVTIIKITGIGERCILARGVSHAGVPVNWSEGLWTLEYRAWSIAVVPDA